jgi:hypothetical protein
VPSRTEVVDAVIASLLENGSNIRGLKATDRVVISLSYNPGDRWVSDVSMPGAPQTDQPGLPANGSPQDVPGAANQPANPGEEKGADAAASEPVGNYSASTGGRQDAAEPSSRSAYSSQRSDEKYDRLVQRLLFSRYQTDAEWPSQDAPGHTASVPIPSRIRIEVQKGDLDAVAAGAPVEPIKQRIRVQFFQPAAQ